MNEKNECIDTYVYNLNNLPCSASQRFFSVSDSRASKTAAPTNR